MATTWGFCPIFTSPFRWGGCHHHVPSRKNMNWVYPPISPIEISIYRKKNAVWYFIVFLQGVVKERRNREIISEEMWRVSRWYGGVQSMGVPSNHPRAKIKPYLSLSIHILIMKTYDLGIPHLKKPPMSGIEPRHSEAPLVDPRGAKPWWPRWPWPWWRRRLLASWGERWAVEGSVRFLWFFGFSKKSGTFLSCFLPGKWW